MHIVRDYLLGDGFVQLLGPLRLRRRHPARLLSLPRLFLAPPPPIPICNRPRRGLEEAIIRRIPTLRYQQHKQQHCAVCLADFREGERLRRLPPCLHSFHIDCIDAWLAAALTCPLCRAHVAIDTHDAAIAAASSSSAAATATSTRQLPDDDEESWLSRPMRRSLSLDSCADKNLYLAMRTIVLQQQLCSALVGHPQGSKVEGSAAVSGRRLRRSFFSFSHGRSSSSPILPIST